MISPGLVARLRSEITALIERTLADELDFAPPDSVGEAARAIEDFFALYPNRPVADNKGGSLFNDCLWLYVLARIFAPRLIVESGVYKGQTSWLFRQACPNAEIHSFDVDLSALVYRDPSITYHQRDWSEAPFPRVDSRTSLAFFDDHINQARRLREAYDSGFRLLLFDDNLPAHNLYATGGPPVPTLEMIRDPDLPTETEISWVRRGRTYRYVPRREDEYGARTLIDRYAVLPDLSPVTRYNPGGTLTAVTLVD
jgi:hypothetical protein